MVAEFLGGEGFEVIEAINGLEALWHVKGQRPDAVVLDLRTPRLGGLEALRRVLILDPGLKVVVMTVHPEDIRGQAVSLGAAAVLAAPFEMRELLNALRSETPPTGVRAQPTGRFSTRPSATPTPGRPRTVLIVEDDSYTGAMLKDFVTALGYEGQLVADSAAALRALVQGAPDLVLLDILLPGLSGLEALPSIRALAPDVPVIMVSGTTDEERARQALARGAFDYIVKPVDLRYLAETVEVALAMSQLARD